MSVPSTVNIYTKGQLVRVKATFTDTQAGGVPADPSVVRAKYIDPAGNITSLLYGTDTALVREDTGVYHVDIDANLNGDWFYRFESSGTGQAANESYFSVDSSRF